MSYEAWGEPDDDYMSVDQAIENGWLSPDSYSKGAMDVLNERIRQVTEEKNSDDDDDRYSEHTLARAGVCYGLIGMVGAVEHDPDSHGRSRPDVQLSDTIAGAVSRLWPWRASTFKPKDRRRNLVRAAALLLAEIDWLDRAEARRPCACPSPNTEGDHGQE